MRQRNGGGVNGGGNVENVACEEIAKIVNKRLMASMKWRHGGE
jgi:hypothetical protein